MIQHETLRACPVCGDTARVLVHPVLTDDAFRTVSGSWSLWRCVRCQAAYLDPRPDRDSIGAAYVQYFTHAKSSVAAKLSWRGRIRRRLENAYLRHHYGADRSGSELEGLLYAALLPFRQMTDVRYRHLPGPGRGRTLLDVGCGSGEFLLLAGECGWQVEGVDPDPRAAALGLLGPNRIRQGGVEVYAGRSACFDLITLSHVIEHVHDPVALVRDCHRLLKPGGRLWIVTPNIDSSGHARFGRFWLGLDAPRHLVLFDESSLWRVLDQAGFAVMRRLPSQLADAFMFARTSQALASGLAPQDPVPLLTGRHWWKTLALALAAGLRPRRREFIYVEATR